MAGILEEVRLYFQASLRRSAAPHLIGKHVRQSENYRVSTVQGKFSASSLVTVKEKKKEKRKEVFLPEFKSAKLAHVEMMS